MKETWGSGNRLLTVVGLEFGTVENGDDQGGSD